ncbi:MAG TPA: hypothetical protein PLS10_10970 [Chitinophagales bacterium]|nr:hypothetical protein [Chitinophagales bacterium]
MKKYLIIIVMLIGYISCKNKIKYINNNRQQSNGQLADWPNNDTQYDTLTGNSDTTQESLAINKLMLRLEKDKFTVKINKQLTTPLDIVLYDQNKIIILKDVATFKLFARSKISDKRMENTFPDFTLYEMNFNSNKDAEQVIKWYLSSSTNLKELKTIDKIFRKANRVYYFETRAEMFRDYINKYAETIK